MMEADSGAVAAVEELSDGELEASDHESGESPGGPRGVRPEASEPGKEAETDLTEDLAEPSSKKRKLSKSSSSREDEDDGGGWMEPTAKQKKRMRKRTKREKKLYQKMEAKLVAAMSQAPMGTPQPHLSARQSDVVRSLVTMGKGEQRNRAMVQKLKTLQFQGLVSHLVTGCPALDSTVLGAEEFQRDHRVVVAWLSMISSDFVRNYPDHFPKVKKLTPCVMFDVEHPGSSTFVKLGLESFLMLPANDDNPPPSLPPADSDLRTRYEYLLSLTELSDNDFPNPSQFDVDPLGRQVREYTSVTSWPECEIADTPEVAAGREGREEMPLIAVDCEMVETERGSELARISVVTEDTECIYDTLVRPELPVLDYRTKYSGLDEGMLENVTTTLKDVHERLASVLPHNSILVGHSLENDFHAMKFRHPFVIDTSYLFTPHATPTMKPALRKICKELLQVDIQNSEGGHNSIEDSVTCMKLVHLKLEKGSHCTVPFHNISPSIFTDYRTRGHTSSIVDKNSVLRTYGKGSSISRDASNDEEAILESVKIIPESKFTFVQLHGVENILKSEKSTGNEAIEDAVKEMDSHVVRLVEGCPEKTVVFVVFGSGDIRKVRKLQQGDSDHQQLKKQVMLARTGCAIGLVIN